jgi:ATP-binding cassette subfamily C protein LapB
MGITELAGRVFARRPAPALQPDLFSQADPESLRDDPLLACLAYVAQSFGHPFSRHAVLSGLPLRGGRLSVDLVERAAGRVGLAARLVQRNPAQVPGIVAPFIVLFANGDACVVTEKRSDVRRVKAVFPAVSANARPISPRQLERDASGLVIYLTEAETAASDAGRPGAPARRGHWLWSVVGRYRGSIAQVVVAALVINLLGLATPLFVMNVYDRVIPNLAIPTLWALIAGVAVALFFDFVLKQLRATVLDATGRRVDMAVGATIFEQVVGASMAARSSQAGSIASQVREFEAVHDFFTSASVIAFTDLIFIGIFIAMMWLLVGPLAWVPAAAVPLVILVTLAAQMPLMRSVRRFQAHAGRRHAVLVESLVGVETIKAVGGEGVVQRRWEDDTAAVARAHSGARLWSSLVINFTGTVQQVVSVVIIAWGVFLVADGAITIGALIAANILSGRVLGPLGGIAQTLARAQQAFTAVRSLNTFMDLPNDRRPGAGQRGVEIGSVAFRNVSFTYPGATRPTLSDVSFEIRAGERVGLIGRIGSGKTTIGRLMAGLYEPQQGAILIGGVDQGQFDLAALRAGVGYVSQDSELFSGSLRDNVVLGRPRAGEHEIEEALHTSGVDQFIQDSAPGLMLELGERGKGLSGGQRQAVALARMLLKKPAVLFLDEPSASMDTSFERTLIERLKRYEEGEGTLIVSTHRATMLELVDRIIVIEAGRVVSDGPKDSVIKALRAGQLRE